MKHGVLKHSYYVDLFTYLVFVLSHDTSLQVKGLGKVGSLLLSLGPGDLNQAIRLGGRHHCLLSHYPALGIRSLEEEPPIGWVLKLPAVGQ